MLHFFALYTNYIFHHDRMYRHISALIMSLGVMFKSLITTRKKINLKMFSPLDNFILQLHICLPNTLFLRIQKCYSRTVRETAPSEHPFPLWLTWVSLISVNLACALGLH